MKNLLLYLAVALMVGGACAQSDLPLCSGKYSFSWNNCFGSHDVKGLGQYSCERKDGYCNGKGTLYFNDGKKYVGEFKDGMRTGKGKLLDSKDKVLSDGLWAENKFLDGEQQSQQSMKSNTPVAIDPTVVCMDELKANTDLQDLYKKLPLDVSKGQSLEVLSNNSKPTAIEKKHILKFMDLIEGCSREGSEWRTKNYPLVINNLGAKYQTDIKIAMADLYSGKLTFGELAKIRTKTMTDFMANLLSEVAKIKEERAMQEEAVAKKAQSDLERERQRIEAIRDRNAQLSAEREAIAEQNAAIAAEGRRQIILQNYMRSLPMFQPIPMPREPITTNCNAFGNQVNCVTR